MLILKYISKIYCSLLGIGFIKRGGATIGAILGVVFFYIIDEKRLFPLLLIWCVILAAGIISSDIISKELDNSDPQLVIIDEFLGAFTTLLILPYYNIMIYVLAIIAFRLFDKFKPFGIKKIESLSGGMGIMLDDVVAGIYANIFLRILLMALKL